MNGLAKKAHTTQKVISRIEHGEVSVGVDLLQRIAAALDLEVNISLRRPSSRLSRRLTLSTLYGLR
ncbi:MAG: helix-turn-helix transcriptional regulator [Nitrospinae bacterium]|nr:helix-turn-helix transcriptional regulator [Nitrospinota bacterium]